jgi:hypothetical protein
MDQGDLGIVLAIVGIAATIGLEIPALRRRRIALHWTNPVWTLGAMKIRTHRVPVLTVRWGVRGRNAIQGVECAVRSPKSDWRVCALPKGRVEPPKEDLYTYVSLLDGSPFNSTISSPADLGKPVEDLTKSAVKGKYQLRIRWFEPERPARRRQKVFSYVVT